MMQIRGMITTTHSDAACVAGSLAPDNLSSMSTKEEDGCVSTTIESGALRSVIASVDDYLMNLEIAEDVCSCVLH